MFKFIFILLSIFSFSYSKINITVTLPVQKYFLEKISKNTFYIRVLKQKNKKFDINDKERIEKLAFSRVYYTIGLEEEKEYISILKSINKSLIIHDLSKNIKKDIFYGKENPYIWFDPIKVRLLAKNIFENLVKLKSYKKDFFMSNYKSFLHELDNSFIYISKLFDKSENNSIFVYEYYWHYFAKRFRLNLYYKDNRYTKIEEISSLIKFSRKNNIRKLLIRRGTSYEQARSLTSHINADIIEHDVEAYDWNKSLYNLTKQIIKR